jgi:hypothetical protein
MTITSVFAVAGKPFIGFGVHMRAPLSSHIFLPRHISSPCPSNPSIFSFSATSLLFLPFISPTSLCLLLFYDFDCPMTLLFYDFYFSMTSTPLSHCLTFHFTSIFSCSSVSPARFSWDVSSLAFSLCVSFLPNLFFHRSFLRSSFPTIFIHGFHPSPPPERPYRAATWCMFTSYSLGRDGSSNKSAPQANNIMAVSSEGLRLLRWNQHGSDKDP